jgi:hypothetical protein
MTARFRLEIHEHGILWFGQPAPVDTFIAVGNFAQSLGFDLVDAGISHATGARFAYTNAESSEAWRQLLDGRANTNPDPLTAWFTGTDVGISAQTIAHVLSDGQIPTPTLGPDVPHDAGDLGRCLRLVRRIEGWEDRLGEVAERYPAWGRIVEHWPELAAWFDGEEYEQIYDWLSRNRT